MENRNGVVVDTSVTQAQGRAERETALEMLRSDSTRRHRTSAPIRATTPRSSWPRLATWRDSPRGAEHLRAPKRHRRRTTRHSGYEVSQRVRKRVEEIFGWMKAVGLMRKTRHKGVDRVGWMFTFAAAVYNLVRMRNLLAEPA